MKVVKIISISIMCVVLLICAGASADPPATQPTGTPAYGNSQQIRRLLHAMAGKTNNVRPYTPDEWNQMLLFMDQYSPARAHLLETLQIPHDSPIRMDAIRKWRNYNFTKEHFPSIADDLIRRFQLEDDLFYLTMKDILAMGAERVELSTKIHDKVKEIVDLGLLERQARVDKLQKMLNEEKSKLTQDKASEEDRVEQRAEMIIMRIDRQTSGMPLPPSTRPDSPMSVDDAAPTAAPDPANNIIH